jgi:hypothetical protein
MLYFALLRPALSSPIALHLNLLVMQLFSVTKTMAVFDKDCQLAGYMCARAHLRAFSAVYSYA